MSYSNINSNVDLRPDAGHSVWRKVAVVWVWAIQLFALPANVIILSILISVAKAGGYSYQSLNIINVAINIISLILICLEITMYQFHLLKPRFYLISAIIKLVSGLMSLALLSFKLKEEWDTVDKYNRYYLFVCLGLSVVIVLTFFVALVYGIIIISQSARRWTGLKNKYVNPPN